MFSIREATNKDYKLIHDLAEQVFPITYKDILTSEQNKYMMDWMYSVANIQKQIEEDGHIYFIAYENESPCGYLSIQQEDKDRFHLQKIYVLPSFQGKGYGKKLFQKAIEYIKNIHPSPCLMVLNVNRNNKALNFYQKLGMRKIDEGNFPIGNGFFMEDYIMGIDT